MHQIPRTGGYGVPGAPAQKVWLPLPAAHRVTRGKHAIVLPSAARRRTFYFFSFQGSWYPKSPGPGDLGCTVRIHARYGVVLECPCMNPYSWQITRFAWVGMPILGSGRKKKKTRRFLTRWCTCAADFAHERTRAARRACAANFVRERKRAARRACAAKVAGIMLLRPFCRALACKYKLAPLPWRLAPLRLHVLGLAPLLAPLCTFTWLKNACSSACTFNACCWTI